MKILLVGGGSGGPVSPVLAVALEIKKLKPKTEFLFVGTRNGPEREMVEPTGIPFVTISATRLRRFFSFKNLFAPIVFLVSLVQAWNVVRKFEPDVVFGAGSFVEVPVMWAAHFLGAKIVIHQQDARIGLANKLVVPFANQITTAFEKTSKDFYSGSGLLTKKLKPAAEWVGNPVRPDLFDPKVDAKKFFGLHDELPVLLVLGGATGAEQINQLLQKALPDLARAHQVVHQTGAGKQIDFKDKNYHAYELMQFEPYAAILKAAHLVVARAGLSTIAELSALAKVAIIIPMSATHQEENAKILEENHAAVVLYREEASAENLTRVINSLKFNQKRVEALASNMKNLMPHDAAEKIAKVIIKTHES